MQSGASVRPTFRFLCPALAALCTLPAPEPFQSQLDMAVASSLTFLSPERVKSILRG